MLAASHANHPGEGAGVLTENMQLLRWAFQMDLGRREDCGCSGTRRRRRWRSGLVFLPGLAPCVLHLRVGAILVWALRVVELLEPLVEWRRRGRHRGVPASPGLSPSRFTHTNRQATLRTARW